MKREELENYYKTSCIKDTEVFYFKDDVDSLLDEMEMTLACYEDEVHQLRKQLEDVQNTMATENVDLGMENHKLKERIKELEREAKDMSNTILIRERRINELESRNATSRHVTPRHATSRHVTATESEDYMRADEPITSNELWDMNNDGLTCNYINTLRYERLMAKAELAKEQRRKYFEDANDEDPYDPITIRYNRWSNIAEALEARAKRIKDGM